MKPVIFALINQFSRDLMGAALVIILGAGLGVAWNTCRTKPLPWLYQTPQERAANCDC